MTVDEGFEQRTTALAISTVETQMCCVFSVTLALSCTLTQWVLALYRLMGKSDGDEP